MNDHLPPFSKFSLAWQEHAITIKVYPPHSSIQRHHWGTFHKLVGWRSTDGRCRRLGSALVEFRFVWLFVDLMRAIVYKQWFPKSETMAAMSCVCLVRQCSGNITTDNDGDTPTITNLLNNSKRNLFYLNIISDIIKFIRFALVKWLICGSGNKNLRQSKNCHLAIKKKVGGII